MYLRLQHEKPATDLVESVLQDTYEALHGRSHARTDIGAILGLYGSIVSLCARAKRIKAIIATRIGEKDISVLSLDELTSAEVRQFSGFYDETLEFGKKLSEISLSVVDIYYPGLKNDLLEVVATDINFSSYYADCIAPKYKLTEANMPPTLFALLDKFCGDWGPQNMGGQLLLELKAKGSDDWLDQKDNDGLFYGHRDIPSKIFVENFLEVSDTLERCRQIIGEIVKEHWSFRELSDAASRVPNIEGGLHVTENRYNINNSQVGAVGSKAHVHDVQFHQRLDDQSRSIDLGVLSQQLDQLKVELAQQASERDHYAALVAVSDAAEDARAGKGGDALAKLMGAGKWALDLATKIGASVAADAIKNALGMK